MVLAEDFCPGVAPGDLHVLMDVETLMAHQMPRVSRGLSGGLRDRSGQTLWILSCSAGCSSCLYSFLWSQTVGHVPWVCTPRSRGPGTACENSEGHPESPEGAGGTLSESCSFWEPVARLDWFLPSASFSSGPSGPSRE